MLKIHNVNQIISYFPTSSIISIFDIWLSTLAESLDDREKCFLYSWLCIVVEIWTLGFTHQKFEIWFEVNFQIYVGDHSHVCFLLFIDTFFLEKRLCTSISVFYLLTLVLRSEHTPLYSLLIFYYLALHR